MTTFLLNMETTKKRLARLNNNNKLRGEKITLPTYEYYLQN